MHPSKKFLTLAGLRIHVKTLGEGKPILFLHGGPGDEHRYFLPHVLPLTQTHQLVFYDQRGCGLSEKETDPSRYTLEAEVETLEALRREMGWEQMNVLGQSWGTMLGLLYATTYPHRLQKLMLVSAVGARGKDLERFEANLLQRMPPQHRKKVQNLERKKNTMTPEEFHDQLNLLLFPWYVHRQENLSRLTQTKISTEVNEALGNDALRRFDLTKNLSQLGKLPVQIIQGRQDLISPEDLRTTLLPWLPHAVIIQFEHSGHWPFLEEPERFVRAVRQFFSVPAAR